MNKYLLFTPGPVNVAENVRAAICKEDICHREVDFDELLLSIEDKLLKLLQIRNIKDYRAVVITGSGTAANESILSSVIGDKIFLFYRMVNLVSVCITFPAYTISIRICLILHGEKVLT